MSLTLFKPFVGIALKFLESRSRVDVSFFNKVVPQPSVAWHERTEEGLRPGKGHSELFPRVSVSRAVGVRRGPRLPEGREVRGALPVDLVRGAQTRHISPVLQRL